MQTLNYFNIDLTKPVHIHLRSHVSANLNSYFTASSCVRICVISKMVTFLKKGFYTYLIISSIKYVSNCKYQTESELIDLKESVNRLIHVKHRLILNENCMITGLN